MNLRPTRFDTSHPIRRPAHLTAPPGTPGRGAQLASVHIRSALPLTQEVYLWLEPRTGLDMTARRNSAGRRKGQALRKRVTLQDELLKSFLNAQPVRQASGTSGQAVLDSA